MADVLRPALLLAALLLVVPSPATELTYWCSPNPEETELARDLVKKWNAAHPKVQVKVQPIPAGASSEEVLLAAIVAKTTPDVCSNILPAIMNRFVKAGAVVALDEFPDFDSTMLARMAPSMLAAYQSRDQHTYQVPWKCNPVVLAYNVDLFRELNIAPPKTYAQFFEVAGVLTRDTNNDGRTDRWAMSPSINVVWWQRLFDFYPFYIAASGGKTLLQHNKVQFNNPAAATTMNFFRQGFASGFFPKSSMSMDLFVAQKVGMAMVGPWAIKYYESAMQEKFEFDFTPVPVPSIEHGKPYTYGDPKNITIFKTSQHPAEAWEFVKYLVSKEADMLLLEMTGQIPIRSELTEDPYYQDFFTKNPKLVMIAEQAQRVAPVDDTPHLVQILDHLSEQYEAAAVYGVVSAEESITSAAEYVENICENW